MSVSRVRALVFLGPPSMHWKTLFSRYDRHALHSKRLMNYYHEEHQNKGHGPFTGKVGRGRPDSLAAVFYCCLHSFAALLGGSSRRCGAAFGAWISWATIPIGAHKGASVAGLDEGRLGLLPTDSR